MTPKSRLICLLFVFILLLDQTSKIVVAWMLPLNQPIPVIANLFNLTYIRNTGAAFGILAASDAYFRIPFFIAFSFIAIAFLLVLLRRLPEKEKGMIVALTFILGGATGNLIDRILYGEVIDFLDFYWSKYHWPAFNFADSFITLGVVGVFYRLIAGKGGDPFSLGGDD